MARRVFRPADTAESLAGFAIGWKTYLETRAMSVLHG